MKTVVVVLAVLLALVTDVMGANTDVAAKVYDRAKGALVIIRGPNGAGTGFVAKSDGKTWLYSNEHVARCGEPLKAVFVDGREIVFKGEVQVAKNRDLIRVEVDSVPEALAIASSAPSLDASIFVFGNSDGAGVLTKLDGKVVGVGNGKIEVSAKFIQGNSGSAILDSNCEVVGVATEAVKFDDPSDWVKLDTRFNAVRRYGERLMGVEWQPLEWDTYVRCCRVYDAFVAYREFLIPLCFKDRQLVTDYSVKDVGDLSSLPSLKVALKRIVQSDKQYLKSLSEFEQVLELRKTLHQGNMRYPKTENVNIRYRKLKRALVESISMRKAALKSAVTSLKTMKWACARFERDAERLLAGFKYCADEYERFNDSSLSNVGWKEE